MCLRTELKRLKRGNKWDTTLHPVDLNYVGNATRGEQRNSMILNSEQTVTAWLHKFCAETPLESSLHLLGKYLCFIDSAEQLK